MASSFRVQDDKLYGSCVRLMAWCPTMDVLALALHNNQLVLHRFVGFQKCFTIPSAAHRITAIAWRPDGKVLSLGYFDGTVSLFDLENGELLASSRPHSAAISCMHWVKVERATSSLTSPEESPYSDRTSNFFPALPALPKAKKPTAADAAPQACDAPPAVLTVLATGAEDGTVALSAHGLFQIAVFDLKKQPQYAQGSRVVRVCLSARLSILSLVVHSAADGSVHGVVVDVSLLSRHRRELSHLVKQTYHFGALLSHMEGAFALAKAQWAAAMNPFQTHLASLASLIKGGYGLSTTPQQEFLHLLACGTPSQPLHQFLVQNLTLQGVARLDKAVETGCVGLQQLVINHLAPACEEVIFRLSELMGHAQWEERYKPVGLLPTLVSALKAASAALRLQLEGLVVAVGLLRARMKAFLLWLQKVIRVLSDDGSALQFEPDLRLVAECIANCITSSSCRQCACLPPPLQLFDATDSPPDAPAPGASASMQQQWQMLNQLWTRLSASPCTAVTSSFAVIRSLPLATVRWSPQPLGSADEANEKPVDPLPVHLFELSSKTSATVHLLAFVDPLAPTGVSIVHFEAQPQGFREGPTSLVKAAAGCVIRDISAYKDNLTLLTTHENSATLAFFPVSTSLPSVVASTASRQRTFSVPAGQGEGSVFAASERGVGSLWFAHTRRLILLDLEDDDEDGGDDDDGDDDGDGDGDDDGDGDEGT
eukprot:gnl/Hemi2/7487_TR2568_c0_g1_i1.p1 gnl/Hemi2/7487_TR2568_c0_g1~~gnl/Hemi2/7487_TR2568_c0_g1_i1.p1  ORF type:complete len:712 (+),score=190.56 gnl/Hemi2/7487_TR2568_c0_g1_i1:94-2229(+)